MSSYMCLWKIYVIILYFVGKFIKSLCGKNNHGLDAQFPLWSSLSKESPGKFMDILRLVKKYKSGLDIWSDQLKHW